MPASVVDVEPSMRTSTSAPACALPQKLTVVFRRVRPRRIDGSVRLGPSTSTSSTRPTRSAFRARGDPLNDLDESLDPLRLHLLGTWSGIDAASVPLRGLKTNVNAPS